MRIGIDARFVGPRGTGLGKYTEKLIENLAQIDSQNSYLIFLKKENWDYLNFKNYQNFKKVLANIPWYSIAEQLRLPKIFSSQTLDLLHVPHFNVPIFYKGKFIVTIHDLIHHQFAETSTTTRNPLIFKMKRLAYKAIISQAVRKSAKIIVPSNSIKNQVIKTFKINPSKIVVTYEAAEEEYFSVQRSAFSVQQLLKKYGIKIPFVIYVGNAYPHKNLEKLLEAFKIFIGNWKLPARRSLARPSQLLRRRRREAGEIGNWELLIVCPRDVFWQRLKKQLADLSLLDRVIMTGYIPVKELSVIFQQAQAYVFPSLAEGFGIPGLNAMATGLPVVCSNIPVLKEIYADAVLYFEPNDPADIAQKIKKVLVDQKTRLNLVKKGSEQVKKYSWRKMAEQTLKIYEKC